MPFLLEPDYHLKGEDFTEPHNERMKRKFGSMENFVEFRKHHDLPGRGAEVHLDELGFVQENLSKRVQSSTVKSHRCAVVIKRATYTPV